jgi:hypothetical protein
MARAGDLLMLINKVLGEPDPLEDFPYVVLDLTQGEFGALQFPINEGWKPSPFNGLMVRVDAANTNTKTRRHVHVSHKKHISAPDKQAAWNDNATRHDKGNFNTKFADTAKARAAARDALGLADDVILENYPGKRGRLLMEAATLVLESATIPSGALRFISEAAQR